MGKGCFFLQARFHLTTPLWGVSYRNMIDFICNPKVLGGFGG
jgi:hypothetical protein